MKKILFALLLIVSFVAKAQVFNNEWIDYSKTYYKFKLGANGLFRISQSTLASAGLGNTPAEQFQLWRNGAQVPIYTSVPSGVLSTSDYIEFWGELNDGKPDKQLYRDPSYQLNDRWSLLTDTATYFLTVNINTSQNFRLVDAQNNIAGNTLSAEPYFMFTMDTCFRSKFNPGYAVSVGSNVYSSSYDKGEGLTSGDITSTVATSGNRNYGVYTTALNNLYVYNGGPAPTFKISISGNGFYTRRYKVTINDDSVYSKQVDYYNLSTDSTQFSLSTLTSNKASVTVSNLSNIVCSETAPGVITCPTDRMVIHKYAITYPRLFNFGGASNFRFTLPSSAVGYYLEISNFSYGSTPPVLYDISGGKRYVADISGAPVLKFALPSSSTNRDLVLVSEGASNVNAIVSMQTRNFINYGNSVGDYLIISNPLLFNGATGNPVEDYRAYRSSVAGGGYNAKIYLTDELVDQFAFGIKKHPLAIRNFIRYARRTFPAPIKNVFLIGRGVTYIDQRSYETNPNPQVRENLDKLNLVPTYGYPASDVLLTAEPGSSLSEIPIGRLSAIFPSEITAYLNKVKEFEQAQASTSSSISDKEWMKNVVHIVGASDENLGNQLSGYMESYRKIIVDTLFGAKVSTFSKQSADAVQQLTSTDLTNLFNQGISLITYFGHSSASTLEFNLDNPGNYSNQGKYPLFIGLGCNAGNFYTYNETRFITNETISEKYVLAPNRGTIGFIASTYLGIPPFLHVWNTKAYKRIATTSYGKTIGEILQKTAEDIFREQSQEDFFARSNIEQTALNGDPAITINPHPKADYAIEDPMVKVVPGFVTVADVSFKINATFKNLGKAVSKKIVVEIKRQFPDQSTVIVRRDTIAGIKFIDSISVNVSIDPQHDKGLNKIIITVDADNDVDEIYETNNTVTKEIMIYEDAARPVYPYNFAIINKPSVKLIASTVNPFSPAKEYRMELDTTELFNSPLKITKTNTSAGGVLEFDPGITFVDSTVYYWRVAPVPTSGPFSWSASSFVYLANHALGFNQSHLYQHLKSTTQGIFLDSNSRNWKFGTITQNLFIRLGSWVTSTSQEGGMSVAVNGDPYIRNTCAFQSVVFNVFDPVTFKPWQNTTINNSGLYGSASNNCYAGRQNNFEYRWDSVSNRKRAMDFMKDVIPDGAYVLIRSMLLDPSAFPGFASMLKYSSAWQADTATWGSSQSLYHYLKNAGFSLVDSFNRPRQFAFIYKKNDPSFTPKWVLTEGVYDNVTLNADCPAIDSAGYIVSPRFGPAKHWKEMRWKGHTMEVASGDNPQISIIGFTKAGTTDTLIRNIDISQRTVDISAINAAQYPYLQLYMKNTDTANLTPYQLDYWRLTYEPAPEGAVAPNIYFSMKDTVDVAEPLQFKIAFKNVSEAPFPDSLKVKAVITDKNNVSHVLPAWKQRALPVNDTLHIHYPVDTRQLTGSNLLYVEVNPDDDQPEQYHFNNIFYKTFYVRPDTLNPLLDVTFDNVHILNHDIVSARPNILIRLKDDAKWFLLNDTSIVKIQVRFPDGNLVGYKFDGATMQLIPAQQPPNNDNTATVNLKPFFNQDGEYELIVSAKDMSQNQSGALNYRVAFQVYNKPMISNMLNYPNPFTTSTAFVFTITGSEVPQNIRIQILTVTGKVVREITKEELGTLHIGRNITEFKWDGTDQYGQKLANGVYLYRVITNLNGKSLDKYKAENDNTDKYFNKGYGKMYLMR